MFGIYILCWGLLLINELSNHHLAAEMNATNYIEAVSSTTKDSIAIREDLKTGLDYSDTFSPADITPTAPSTVNCTSLAVEVLDMTPLNDGYLYIGSTAIVSVSIDLPVGFIKELEVKLTHDEENIDFRHLKRDQSGNINYKSTSFIWTRHRRFQTSFQRMKSASYTFYNITTSYSNSTENRLFSKFYVYLHNAKDLQDGQTISIYADVHQWNETNVINCPFHELQFTTKTQLLETNKTAYFSMVTPKTSELLCEINQLTQIKFKAWIPYYNPLIKVLLQRHAEYIWIAYLRVTSIGLSFRTHYADIGLLRVSSCADNTSLLLEFPSHWVNRDYYNSLNTTDYDVIEFEAGVIQTGSAGLESEQNIGISILFNDKEAWNSTVSLTVNSANGDVPLLVRISIDDDLVNRTIVSFSNIPLKLIIETPSNMAEILNIKLWTGNLLRESGPAVTVTNVSFGTTDMNMTCNDLNAIYNNTDNSLVQNLAMIHLKYINYNTGIITGSISLDFEVNIVPEKMNFADTYIVFVATGNVTSEYNIDMTLPEILNGRNTTLLKQFHNLLDGDNNTCVDLPVNGDYPPLFWTRVHTAWLRIKVSPFEMTLIGKEIPCQRNGSKISQVYFPTSSSKNGFHGDLKICDVTYKVDMDKNYSKCVYSCHCNNDVECSEVILFMANHENASVWNLCEISAVNV